MPINEAHEHHKMYEAAFNAGDADGILALFEEGGIQAAGDAQRQGETFRARLRDQFQRRGLGHGEHHAGAGSERRPR